MSDSAPTENRQEYQDDEISLKELILKLQEFWYELWRNWWLILIVCIPFLSIYLYQHFTFEKDYTANLTFMVNEDEGGSAGGVAGVLGSFGLGGGRGDYNLEKMLSLLKSRKIIQNVLFEKLTLNNKSDYFANHFIEIEDLHTTWSKSNSTIDLSNFMYSNGNISEFNLEEKYALKTIHNSFIGNSDRGISPLLGSSIVEETGIMSLNFKSKSEAFSIQVLKKLFDHLSEYYVEKTIEKQQNTYNIVAVKADSLQAELRSAEYSLANFMDKNRGLYNRKDQLEQLRFEAKVKMLSTAYGKVIEQKEIAEFSLNDQTPVVQVIDYPISPIEPSKSSLIKSTLLALFLGGFIASIFIIGRKIIRDALE
jgi:uncharacterized protein involved in exopolysaccharide biosynthesis